MDKFDSLSVIDNVLEVNGSSIDPAFFHPSERAIRAENVSEVERMVPS